MKSGQDESNADLRSQAKKLHQSRLGEFSLTGILPPLILVMLFELKLVSFTEKNLFTHYLLITSSILCGFFSVAAFFALGKLTHVRQVYGQQVRYRFEDFSIVDVRYYFTAYYSGSFAMFFFSCASMSLFFKLFTAHFGSRL